MNPLTERAIVVLIVLVSVAVALRTLLPFAWRARIARAVQGRVPDRVLIWIAGRHGCDACGGATAPRPPRR
jgi:hypothetical protein